MLGGLGGLSELDLKGSEAFFRENYRCPVAKTGGSTALDVGAGIGRIASGLLGKFFAHVSLLEANERFILQARQALGEACGSTFACPLQEFSAAMTSGLLFDIVWIQWVLIYLSDSNSASATSRRAEGLPGRNWQDSQAGGSSVYQGKRGP